MEEFVPAQNKNPIIWSVLIVAVIVIAAALYYLVLHPRGKSNSSGNTNNVVATANVNADPCLNKSNSFGDDSGTDLGAGLGVGMTDRTTCYWNRAIDKVDSSYCYKITGGIQDYHIPRCIAEVGVLKKDPNECKQYRERTGDQTNECESMYEYGLRSKANEEQNASDESRWASTFQNAVDKHFFNTNLRFKIGVFIYNGSESECQNNVHLSAKLLNDVPWKNLNKDEQTSILQYMGSLAAMAHPQHFFAVISSAESTYSYGTMIKSCYPYEDDLRINTP